MSDNTLDPQESPKDSEAVLSLQEMESEQDEVEAHISTLSGSIVGSCGGAAA